MSGFIRKYLTAILLSGIILLAILFRFWNFPHNPPSLNWDEVAIGYNAHSIIETGKDEYGKSFPLYFRSLDDNKLSGYIYMTVLSEYIFGYNDFAVRFPSAFFGTLTVLVVYFLAKELTGKKQIGFLSALVFAIIPWHVQFSRMALEANLAFFILLTAIWTFLLGVRRNQYFLSISFLLFSLTLYTYLSFRIITPFIVIILLWIYKSRIRFKEKAFAIGILIFLCVFSFTVFEAISQKGNLRLRGISIINNQGDINHEMYEVQYEGTMGSNLPRRFFHEFKPLVNARFVARGYFTPFSSDFLFFDVSQKHHHTPNIGLLYLWMLPFILIGAYFLVRKYKFPTKIVILSLIVLAPIPASVTFDVPHAIRTIILIFPLTILTAIGIYEFSRTVKYKFPYLFPIFVITFAGIIFVFSWYFFRQYQMHLPHERSADWQYGRKEMAVYVSENQDKYKNIVFSPKLETPHIFMLYYSKYDPKKYLSEGGTQSGTWDAQTNKFSNYEFRYFTNNDFNKNVLLIGPPTNFPPNIKTMNKIYTLNKLEAVLFVRGDEIKKLMDSCTTQMDESQTEQVVTDYNFFLKQCF